MEAVEEPLLQNSVTELTKNTDVACEGSTEVVISEQSEVCHKPNGVAEADTEPVPSITESELPSEQSANAIIEENQPEIGEPVQESVTIEEIEETLVSADEEVTKEVVPIVEEIVVKNDSDVIHEEHEILTESVEIDGIVESMPENVRFETEILIETNVDDQHTNYKIIYEDEEQPDHTNNILNDIGQNIELSEVLRSSNVTENVENNNCEVAQEVFNKEELLDILEGNDIEESKKETSDTFAADCKKLETQLALQQLSRLKQTRKTRTTPKKMEKKIIKIDSPKEEAHLTPRKRTGRHKEDTQQTNTSPVLETKVETARRKSSKQKEELSQSSSEGTTEVREDVGKRRGNKQKDDNSQSGAEAATDAKEEIKKKKNKQSQESQSNSEPVAVSSKQTIVNALVQDWDDDEPSESVQAKKIIEESDQLLGESEELVKTQEAAVNESQISNANSSIGEELTPSQNKNDAETQPQRRLSRVIKKKVIFDPDNPDTFTKTKVIIKTEKPEKEPKEQPTPKKMKTDITPRSKSKSPIQSKLQWKKPQPKNLKQNKRLTEIDRLLMDEGAVNMICQLTPEAPQGNKNMKSKAEFIKKIQSSTPEGKEMKFRERKKEIKEEGDAKKIGGGKHSLSLNNSVKSPSASEDFEAHSADDSIIYRRHSSSSYSSPCMSPRRMSDVEGVTQNTAATPQQQQPAQPTTPHAESAGAPQSDAFMADAGDSPTTPVINKNNLMSMKEKLNSKLSLALNKRKRESTKPEKPTKMKRVSKPSEKVQVSGEFKYLKLSTDHNLAEICIQSEGSNFNVEVMNELQTALDVVNSNSGISVTLLTSETGNLCSGLALNSELISENGANHAIELAESVRLLLSSLERHSKLICTAVEDRCQGLALAMIALSDVTVASETASFKLGGKNDAPLQPGAAVLTTCGLTQSLVNELVLFDRTVSAREAVHGGLVSRTVWPAPAQDRAKAIARDIVAQVKEGGASSPSSWPERVPDQARAIAKDLASQPQQNILLKKQLLRIKRGPSETFQMAIQMERDQLIKYWNSAEGKELIRASLETAKE